MTPNYAIPLPHYLDLAVAILLSRPRSFRALARQVCAQRGIPARVLGREHIPQGGPGLITINHFHSPTFWSAWIALSVSAQIEQEVYWTMASNRTYPPGPLARPLRISSRWLFGRVARVYGFNSMPPMPPDPDELADRAAAVRCIMRYAREQPSGLIGLAPEGSDQPGGRLAMPPDGVGRLALALARRGMPIYPAGIFEAEDGCPTLTFGPPYQLSLAGDRSESIDRQARMTIMRAIAQCLPPHLRGEFA